MCDDEIEVSEEYPIRWIEIDQGVSEDGGGLRIAVRLDGEPAEKVIETVLILIERLNGKRDSKTQGVDVH
ncbi:hypothetical protein [Geoglobus acetivorans]|uniref:Uncharacterized protein n=1 Tax=Geoglobus acetivorans TaxID=565033 RepID=A0A0A7GDS4_GEOAI|nr:hypothetical protein GACE_1158 [Geoglobus acetivorans]